MALEETSDALASLAAAGIAVRRLIVNRVTPCLPRRSGAAAKSRRSREATKADASGVTRAAASRRARWPRRAAVRRPRDARRCRSCRRSRAASPRCARPRRRSSPGRTAVRRRRSQGRVRAPLQCFRLKAEATGRSMSAALAHESGASAFRRKERARRICSTAASAGSSSAARGASGSPRARRRRRSTWPSARPATRVLLLSMDPAHSLGDVFGAPLGDRARAGPRRAGQPARARDRRGRRDGAVPARSMSRRSTRRSRASRDRREATRRRFAS